jgi:hypothetical protein
MTTKKKRETVGELMNHARPATPTEVIDITPVGMQIPEGVTRVNKALSAYEDFTRGFASVAARFLEEYEVQLIEMVASEDKGDPAIREDWTDLQAIRRDYRKSHDTFLRAVAGAPERKG